VRYIWALLVLIAVGCGKPTVSNQGDQPVLDPNSQPPISETATKSQADSGEIKAAVDLDEYPGATIVDNLKLSSPSMAPDEVRFELGRKSTDAPAKVVSFYESKLSGKGAPKDGGTEVFGQTAKGNFIRVVVQADGSGSKFTLNIISYAKK